MGLESHRASFFYFQLETLTIVLDKLAIGRSGSPALVISHISRSREVMDNRNPHSHAVLRHRNRRNVNEAESAEPFQNNPKT
jgi:hypothetical protein